MGNIIKIVINDKNYVFGNVASAQKCMSEVSSIIEKVLKDERGFIGERLRSELIEANSLIYNEIDKNDYTTIQN